MLLVLVGPEEGEELVAPLESARSGEREIDQQRYAAWLREQGFLLTSVGSAQLQRAECSQFDRQARPPSKLAIDERDAVLPADRRGDVPLSPAFAARSKIRARWSAAIVRRPSRTVIGLVIAATLPDGEGDDAPVARLASSAREQ